MALGMQIQDPPAPAADGIPILDLGPYLAGRPGALAALGAQLRHASENIGFYFITNHGVPQALIDRMFAEAARFHALPLDEKLKTPINHHNQGYMPIKGATTTTSKVNTNTKPNLNESFFIRRQRAPDDPAVLAGIRFKGLNQWPADLPGFRETALEYFAVMEGLAQRLLPVYARSLDLPERYFNERFEDAHANLRLSHYPPADYGDNEFGSAPHTDAGFMTMLAQSKVPGLEIKLTSGEWIPVPVLPGSILVNLGDTLNRWSNHRFLSTPHRVRNVSGVDRYAIPFFYSPNTETLIECLPSCTSADNPPRYPPLKFGEWYTWFITQNYAHNRKDPISGTPRP